ncbi:hypothetical protein [Helicobacter pylori]|uniref:hypothetical protein n=1 Tax=Helicobacter pylori TaxID=210 RepID=UPI001037CAD0|nr:hypothetical protein [Helicobacter pylori]
MRQKNETAASFNQLKEITQIMQAQSTLTPKARAQAKKRALKPTKRAFSERQNTAFRDSSQASDEKRLKTKQANQQGDNANAFKSDETNNSNLRAEPSDEAQKQGLKNTQENKNKGGE